MNPNFDDDPYPLDCFPYKLALLAQEIQKSTMTPGALPAMSILTALSVSCQGLADVQLPIPGEPISPVSLNLLFVGESGERRTMVDSKVCAPIYAHDEQVQNAHEAAMSDYAPRKEVWSLVRKRLVSQIAKAILSDQPVDALQAKLDEHLATEPKAPRLRRFIRQDSTARAMFENLQGDGETVALMTDEGQIMLDSSMMRNLGLSNKLWDGARILSMDRAEFDSIVVRNPRATYSIMTHPNVLKKYQKKYGDVASGSGHWARYLIACPASMKGFRMDWGQGPSELVELPAFHERVAELLKAYSDKMDAGNFSRQVLEFDEEAIEHWKVLARKVESELRPGLRLQDISDFASKFMEIMSRLAALFHYFSGLEGAISKTTLEHAESILIWHLRQYKRLFGERSTGSSTDQDATDLLDFLHSHYWSKYEGRVLPSTLLHVGPSKLRTKWRRDAALNTLTAWGAIRIEYENPLRETKPYIVLNDTYFQRYQDQIAA